jgi:hypothetical protein
MALIEKTTQNLSIAYLHGDNMLYAYKGGKSLRKNIVKF